MAREKWDNLLFKKVWFPVIKRNLQEENLLYKILQTSVIFLSLINLWIQMKYHQKSYFICCPLPTSLGTRAETENSSELLFKISPKYYQSPKKKKKTQNTGKIPLFFLYSKPDSQHTGGSCNAWSHSCPLQKSRSKNIHMN